MWEAGSAIKCFASHSQEEVAGTVFGYDASTGVVIIKEPGTHGGVVNLRLYKTAQLEVLNFDQLAQQFGTQQLPHVDKERARQREEKALQAAEADMAKVGVGVTKEAQSIFDSLSKTMPCVWCERTISVMDVVTVEPPYTVDSVTTTSDHKGALERVKKVLQAERQRMGLLS